MKSIERVGQVYRAARGVVATVDAVAAAAGLTAAELDVLAALAGRAPCPVGTIAADTGQKPSTLTSVLDRLAARGFVTRTVSPDDRRSFVVRLTPAGRRGVQTLERRLAAVARALGARPAQAQIAALASLPARLEAAARSTAA